MFVLRRITSQQKEINTCLGDHYILVLGEQNLEDYEKTCELFTNRKDDPDIYGFIVYSNGQSIMPLYKKSLYFVMTGSGQTFANVSPK